MSAPEIIRTTWQGIPCEIAHQVLAHDTETVFWLNPGGENLPAWPTGHKTIRGVTAAEWAALKAAAQVPALT